MLRTLRIRNLALVHDLSLEFGPGFTAVTGETGAGKSVILGALDLVLGSRADRGSIRAGADACAVEAEFDVRPLLPSLAPYLDEHGLEPCEEGILVVKRSFTAAGTNRQFVNGTPTQLATLAALGDRLLDLHGPHEHQSLLAPARQLALLDAYGGLGPRRAAYQALVAERAVLGRERAELVVDDAEYARRLDLLRHQVREIADARLRPDEETEVAAEHARCANAARLLELSQGVLAALDGDDGALLTALGAPGRALQELARLDPRATALLGLHAQAADALRELQAGLSRYADRVDLDPARLSELEARLDLIHTLRRKYGGSLAEIIAGGEEARRRLTELESRDAEIARLDAAIHAVESRLRAEAAALSAARRGVVAGFDRAVRVELRQLGFRQGHLETAVVPVDPGDSWPASGLDRVEFQFAPNPGEPARPLRAIASSGELARVMLALKTVLADQDDVPVLVFDEVDANVGGETAHAVGEKMRRIAARRQVLCITHLPQVAAHAAAQFVVTKELRAGRSESRVAEVAGEARAAEIARMLGGGPAALLHARELLASR